MYNFIVNPILLMQCPAQTLTISTRFVAAAVKSLLTVGSGKGWGAAADVATSEFFLTRPSVKAGVICTRHCNDLTVLSIESLRTCTGVIVLQILQRSNIQILERVNINSGLKSFLIFKIHSAHKAHQSISNLNHDTCMIFK